MISSPSLPWPPFTLTHKPPIRSSPAGVAATFSLSVPLQAKPMIRAPSVAPPSAFMHFPIDTSAVAREAKGELPARPGVSQGTALYYLGLALEKLSYRSQALEAYRAAAGFKDATLINNDGPAVAPLAARRGGS